MEREITIDRAGRLVIPKDLRERHHLEAGTRLTVLALEDRIILIPRRIEPRLIEKDGLLVVASPLDSGSEVDAKSSVPAEISDADHRRLREERLQHLGGTE